MGWQDAPVIEGNSWQSAPVVEGGLSTGPTAPKQSFLGKIGSGLASLADTTIGGVLPLAGQVVQAASRPFTTPQRAEELGGVVSSALEKPFGKAFGVTEMPAYKQESSRQLMDFIGANVNKGADWIANQTGAPVEDVRNMLGTSLLAVPAAVKGTTNLGVKAVNSPMGQSVIEGQLQLGNALAERLVEPLARSASAKGTRNLAKSYQNASQIEASQAAQRMGVALDPAVSNPTTGNVIKGALTGTTNKQSSLSKINEGVWVDKSKEVIGADKNSVLDTATFDAALDKVNRPLDPIKKIVIQPNDEVMSSLDAARVPERIGDSGSVAAVDKVVDQSQRLLSKPRSVDEVLGDIRQLRRNANGIYQSQKAGMAPDSARVAEADASIAIANTLEQLIEANAPNIKALDAIRAAREKSAQIFDVERATNKTTGRVDPLEFAKMINEGKPLTGLLRDMGMVAGNFPSIAVVDVNASPRVPSVSRSGPAGTMGYAVGTATGMSPSATATVGSGIGGVIGELAARRIAKPEYQAANAIPRDYRPPVNNLRPVEPSYSPNQPVPYDYSQSSFVPPNFVMRGEGAAAPIFEQPVYPQLTQFGDFQTTANAFRNQELRAGARSREAGQLAEAQQAAAEAAARQPARGGTVFDLDPITGKLVPVDTTLRGATPDIQIIESTGKNLASAVAKMSGQTTFETRTQYRTVRTGSNADGSPIFETRPTDTLNLTSAEAKQYVLPTRQAQAFNMTAEEKIAWNKAKADLAEVAPSFKTLSDKEIASKLQDRAWLKETIDKVKQKAKMQDEILARSNDFRARQLAMKEREKLQGDLELLEERFRKARPTSTGGQGPKTREFQRKKLNMLSDQDAVNELLNR